MYDMEIPLSWRFVSTLYIEKIKYIFILLSRETMMTMYMYYLNLSPQLELIFKVDIINVANPNCISNGIGNQSRQTCIIKVNVTCCPLNCFMEKVCHSNSLDKPNRQNYIYYFLSSIIFNFTS